MIELKKSENAKEHINYKSYSYTINLSDATQEMLLELSEKIKFNPYQKTNINMRQEPYRLPLTITPLTLLIREMFWALKKYGCLIVANVPLGCSANQRTPIAKDYDPKFKPDMISEKILYLLSSSIGYIFSYGNEKKGDLVHNIYPLPESVDVLSNEGSELELNLHNEVAYFDNRPDYLVLSCLKSGNEPVFTRISDAILGYNQISSLQHKMALMKEQFYIRPPYSFEDSTEYKKVAVVESSKDTGLKGRVNLNRGIIKTDTSLAKEAFQKFSSILNALSEPIFLKQGDMLFIDNARFVHGRQSFKPMFDGSDRWLQRAYIGGIN